MPASIEPIIAQCAPAAIALAMSPENLIPPSAITGWPLRPASSAQSSTAVSCGTPTPATMRVVQIEPGPMPTLTASAPASISARVASAVATLPATTCTEFEWVLTRATASATAAECPCAVSITMRSTPASISAWLRSKPLSPTVVAAATRSRPSSSLQACGFSTDFWMSLTVRSPVSSPLSFTTSSFSMRRLCSSRLAAARSTGSRTVARFARRHQLADRGRRLLGEAHVAVGQDADQPVGRVDDRETR